ncbi:hypothetical protein C2G38_2140073 [Gigaspora rosea]|uniref:BTB domain-containing protein n=1 Tax=Gigaspora rosea TaxID=44941 RepID=A0A397VN88_9GLOM|nr:hypothetical protein C2G38_2140073 [Gigaspora rosea]
MPNKVRGRYYVFRKVKVDKQSFKLHSQVLYQRSSFFRQELTTATKKNNIIEITLTDTSIEAFKILITYIYTGTIPLEEVEPSIIFDLLVPSKKLGLVELVEYIQSYLIDNKAFWLRLKFTQVYSTSFQDNNFKALQTFCTDILAKHPNLIFDSNDFTSIQENALVTLLKRDDLQVEESEIWDKVIQWGKAKTPDLPFELKQWTEKNFLDLKNTLSKCIPLIRYFQMSGEEILAKVKPYQQILGFNLWDDISTRGSRDGFTRETFHQLCDNLPGTVVVIKVDSTNEILGGYNSLVWTSKDQLEWFTTTDSFVFSLKTQNLPNSILSRIIHANKVIGCANYYGPVFSSSFWMHDDSKQWYYVHDNSDYEKPIGSNKSYFFIDEFEVFQVLKN